MNKILKNFILLIPYVRVFLFIFIFSFVLKASASDVPYNTGWDVSTKSIRSSASDENYVYLGGNFKNVMPFTSSAIKLDTSTGAKINFPSVNGTVNCITPAPSGGWYIGGTFTLVGGAARNRIARINADGTLHAWNANADNAVNEIVYLAGALYVAGDFSNIGGLNRLKLAKLDTITGAANSMFAPIIHSESRFYALAAIGTDLFVGGFFDEIGGNGTIRNLARLNNTSGTPVVTWRPNPNSTVRSLFILSSSLYVGGNFTMIAGASRTYLARLIRNTAAIDSWNCAIIGGAVRTIIPYGANIIIGGEFLTVNGYVRTGLAIVSGSDGTQPIQWNAALSGRVRNIILRGSTLYAGGEFDNGTFINKINAITGEVYNWGHILNSAVNDMAIIDNNFLIGGDFFADGGKQVNNLIRVNKATGVPDTMWVPNVNGIVSEIVTSTNYLYIAGSFTTVNGVQRVGIAKINKSDGSLVSGWSANINANTLVRDIEINGNDVYVGGDFTTVGGNARNRLAKLSASTGAVDANWNPNANGTIFELSINGNNIYAAGEFSSIGGQNRRNAAKLNNTNGNADAVWNPSPDYPVYAMAMSGNDIFLGGYFYIVGGVSKLKAAKLNDSTGAVDLNWSVNLGTATIELIAINGEDVYVASLYDIVKASSSGSIDSTWKPAISGEINTINTNGNEVYIGGTFGKIKNQNAGSFAFFRNESVIGVGKPVVPGAGVVSFNEPSDTTAVSIGITSGTGEARINVFKYNNAPANIEGTYVFTSKYRWIIQQEGISSSFSGQVRFKLSQIHNEVIGSPSNVTIFSRPTPGTGTFTALPTSYDAGTGELVATVTSFSEFVFSSDGPLPVELASFTSTVNGNKATLNWSTVTEINNSGFEIERKAVGINEWKKTGVVAGAGNSNEVKNYSYTEIGLAAGKYNYRLKQIDLNGNFEYHTLANEVIIGIPSKFKLSQNYPNPFNPSTKISFQLPKDNFVSLIIFDMTGREVASIVNEMKIAGYYSVNFNGANLSSGVYFYKLQAGEFVSTKKMILVK